MSGWTPYLLGVAAGLSIYAGGLLALRVGDRRRDLLFGLAGGLMVGLALLDLLPEALASGAASHGTDTILGAVAGGVALYLLLHRVPTGGAAARASLIAHSVMDGLGIGLVFQLSAASGWLVAFAVLAHDVADGANMVALGTATSTRRTAPRTIHRWLLVNAAAPLAGVAIGQTVHVDLAPLSLLLATFAGGFLYIGACELLPRSRAVGPGYASGLASLAGLGLMACVVHLAG